MQHKVMDGNDNGSAVERPQRYLQGQAANVPFFDRHWQLQVLQRLHTQLQIVESDAWEQ